MYPCVVGRVDDEDDDVGALDNKADAVDGEDEGAVGVDDGEPVKEPEQAVHERRQIGVRLELLHVLGLVDPPERWPAYVQAENKYQIHALASYYPQATTTFDVYRLDKRETRLWKQG